MLTRFFRSESSAAIVLLSAAIAAILVANSPLSQSYADVLTLSFLGTSLHHWINDGLMALFFLLVGMEIKQELRDGALSTWRTRALPGAAALGGMILPAIIFVLINRHESTHLSGWAIPAATDIAFAIGVLALLGSRVPSMLRVLLVGIAIIDDLLAIVVIACFYTSDLHWRWLVGAVAVTLVLAALNRLHIDMLLPYLLLGVVLWYAIDHSGLHATLAGVILAMAIPASSTHDLHRSPLKTTEHAIDRWVNFGILPLFAFANAGIAFAGIAQRDVIGVLPVGIALGLLLGKQLGVFGITWALIRFRVVPMPSGVTWGQLHAMSVLCGIGFTMSLFIGGLAFVDSPELLNATRIGVIGGSLCSGVIGTMLLRRTLRPGREIVP